MELELDQTRELLHPAIFGMFVEFPKHKPCKYVGLSHQNEVKFCVTFDVAQVLDVFC